MLRLLTVTLALCATICAAAQTRNQPMEAIAHLTGPPQSDNTQVKGNVTFIQNDCGQSVHVRIQLENVMEGKHGFHIHEKGDLSNGCASLGGHYNPDKVDHGAPHHEVRHVGDLGNIEVNASRTIDITYTDSVISLSGKRTIIGRSVVLHEMEDDLGLGNHTDSKKTGNAGGRIACGVIGINTLAPYEQAEQLPDPLPEQAESIEASALHSTRQRTHHTANQPTFYVPHDQPHDHVIYPLLRHPYPYAYPYYL
ncbi:extracellular superoxide dismutase [Cu-Zn] isoform X1 [Drosophila navojoa]|uniref:extracellular superoxide dismutase [Cu-Zn] isoform X1 n=1 Tax=Drosophila navojoa TaxID=7232 RepID=UPI000846BCCD|nr:extracellular superoxide dismutase [Cu-Zn] isoform X1 [Drosophila navojoa]XP_030238054.1 extracellular superoxide dismutase [Cu-Zn] isoform X1 [Drosophila navojoa]